MTDAEVEYLSGCGRGCYVIGGPWITCDPCCPIHGDEAVDASRRAEEILDVAKSVIVRGADTANAIRATVEHLRAVIRSKRIDRATLELLAADLENVANAIPTTDAT